MLIARDYSRKSGAKVLLFLHICKKKCEKVSMFQRLKLFFEGFMPPKGRWDVRDEWNNSLCMSGRRWGVLRLITRLSYVYLTYMLRISYVYVT